jgi:hypothetical protein
VVLSVWLKSVTKQLRNSLFQSQFDCMPGGAFSVVFTFGVMLTVFGLAARAFGKAFQ